MYNDNKLILTLNHLYCNVNLHKHLYVPSDYNQIK